MTIALDIDGTITGTDHLIPDRVASYFQKLYRQGWQFAFLTGRTFSFAQMTLSRLGFPYLLALNNGADLLEMPQKNGICHVYLDYTIVPVLDELYCGYENDFVIYDGYKKGSFVYFRSDRFSDEMLGYFKEVETLSAEVWKGVGSFERFSQSTFPLVKCIGSQEMLELFDQKLKTLKGIATTVIADPVSCRHHLMLITHEEANKGRAMRTFVECFLLGSPLITGGNDNNDLPLLKEGDIRIAMDGSPEDLKNLAHILAPSADEMGIIEGLQEAIKQG